MSEKEEVIQLGRETLYPQALVADLLGCTVRTLENWRSRRIGPAWCRLGHRLVYRQSSLERWIEEQESSNEP